MKFEFNTEVDGVKEATALATALTVLYGGKIATALDNALQSLEDEPVTHAGVTLEPGQELTAEEIAAAIATNEPSAAEAFGGNETFVGTATDQRPRDKDGIPWDARIHSGNKGTNKDGTWTRRRNTDDALFDRVMTELKTGVVADTSAAEAFENPTPSEAPAPPVTDGSGETGATVGQTAPTVASPSSQEVPPPPPPPTAAAPITFPILMVKITKLQSSGKIDKATVDGFLNAFDMKEAKELAKATPDVVAAINAMVDGHVGD